MSKVTVIGSGGGGRALAADFATHGHQVTLFEFPPFASGLGNLREEPVIRLVAGGEPTTVRIASVTTDAAVFAGGEYIFPVVPAFTHGYVADALTPHLGAQTVCFFGEGSGTLMLRQALGGRVPAGLTLAEANTLPYLARLTADGDVTLRRKTGGVLVAALPAHRADQVLGILQPIYPFIRRGENVLETILINFNAIDHVAPMVLNAGAIEGGSAPFKLWGTGGTPGVIRAIEAVDREILAIRSALGFQDRTPYKDYLYEQGFIAEKRPTYDEAVHASPLNDLAIAAGPQGLTVRFLTEDVPYALTLISSIGQAAGVATPTIDALITLSGILLNEDFRATGRTLQTLGLPTSRDELLGAVTEEES